MLIDTHAHLNDSRLMGEFDAICDNARADGLEAIINVGYDLASSIVALEQANKNACVFAAAGIHPHDAKTADQATYDKLKELLDADKIVAAGEFGLDYYYDLSPRNQQKESMMIQAQIACQKKLPIIIHCRDAYADMLQFFEQNKSLVSYGGVMHCYGGSVELSKKFLDLGFYLSFGGVLTFKNAQKAREVLLSMPLDRLLLETDCPYLTPEPFRGRLNYPKYVKLVAQRAAQILDIPFEQVCEISTKNAHSLFCKLKKQGVMPK